MVVNYRHRKTYQLSPVEHAIAADFYECSNFYSDAYEGDLELSKRNEYN
jgi:hypothetical protein